MNTTDIVNQMTAKRQELTELENKFNIEYIKERWKQYIGQYVIITCTDSDYHPWWDYYCMYISDIKLQNKKLVISGPHGCKHDIYYSLDGEISSMVTTFKADITVIDNPSDIKLKIISIDEYKENIKSIIKDIHKKFNIEK